MRFLFGVVVGIALTLGAALLHDNNVPAVNLPPPAVGNAADQPIVNWDALGAVVRSDTAVITDWWNGLMGRVRGAQQP